MQTDDQLVMPIIIELKDDDDHEAVIGKVATDVLEAARLASGSPGFPDWLATGMRKTVRRTKTRNDQVPLRERHADQGEHALVINQCYVGVPKPYREFTRFEKRARVSGWDLNPRTGSQIQGSTEALRIAVLDTLTTGKAAAAAAHVATLIALDEVLDELVHWFGMRIELVSSFDPSATELTIADAGHTEVEPGTITAGLLAR